MPFAVGCMTKLRAAYEDAENEEGDGNELEGGGVTELKFGGRGGV